MGAPHRWTAEEEAILPRVASGEITVTEARDMIGVGYDTVLYRLKRLGLRLPQKPASRAAPDVPLTAAHGWVPIAIRGRRGWHPLPDAPMTQGDAMALSDAGKAFVMHRKVDGEWNLEVRMRA